MDDPDDVLWDRVQRDDATAFEHLYRRHASAVNAYCVRSLAAEGMTCDADDVVAQVFLEAWRRRAEVSLTRDSALPWLYGVARFTLANRARSRRRGERAVTRLDLRLDDQADRSAEVVDARDRLDRVLRAMSRLPEPDRAVLVLCVWQELDYADAAVALKVPIGTVRSRLARARKKLARLEQEEEVRSA